MNVIKPGELPGSKVIRGDCKVCDCIVEAQVSEAVESFHDQRDGVTIYWVQCPTVGCGARIACCLKKPLPKYHEYNYSHARDF